MEFNSGFKGLMNCALVLSVSREVPVEWTTGNLSLAGTVRGGDFLFGSTAAPDFYLFITCKSFSES